METLKVYEESPNTLVKMKKGPGRALKELHFWWLSLVVHYWIQRNYNIPF
jgi:hypothetical protein